MPSVVEELRSFFQNHGWCQNGYQEGNKFCLLGAMKKIHRRNMYELLDTVQYRQLKQLIWNYIETNNLQHDFGWFEVKQVAVATFNDHSSTTFETIKKLLQ